MNQNKKINNPMKKHYMKMSFMKDKRQMANKYMRTCSI